MEPEKQQTETKLTPSEVAQLVGIGIVALIVLVIIGCIAKWFPVAAGILFLIVCALAAFAYSSHLETQEKKAAERIRDQDGRLRRY